MPVRPLLPDCPELTCIALAPGRMPQQLNYPLAILRLPSGLV
jgi:hypothetical protein